MTDGRIAVIGGGAAGMAAAIFAGEAGIGVDLYEQNDRLGKKLRITGKGRCNVTNNCTPDEFFREVVSNPKFLYSAIRRFSPADTMDFFERLGVPLKTERGRRVFPVSDKAGDIVDAMRRRLGEVGVRVIRDRVDGIALEDSRVSGIRTGGKTVPYEKIIVATGGSSYPATGSRGDGYRFAREAGLEVVPPSPSLVPIVTRENVSEMSGLSLKNVRLTLLRGEKTVFEDQGEMLITHFGLSGPLVLSASARMTGDIKNYRLSLDMKPALSDDGLDARLLSDFRKFANRDFANSLGELLPLSMIPYIVARSGIPPHIKVNSVTREMRRTLLTALKSLTFTPIAFRGMEEAIVTRGGVSVKELDPKTMMAKKVPGLYFAGEVIDCDAVTGGYNLQIAFSTAYQAAME